MEWAEGDMKENESREKRKRQYVDRVRGRRAKKEEEEGCSGGVKVSKKGERGELL